MPGLQEPLYRSLKTSLHSVLKTNDKIDFIKNIVTNVNHLRFHILQFTKLYFLHLLKNNESFPILHRDFFSCIARVLTVSKNKRKPFAKNIDLFQQVSNFYNNHYKKLINPGENVINIDGIRETVRYMITDIITDYENNIKMRYFDHVKNYLNCLYEKQKFIENIKKIEKNKINLAKIIKIKQKHINYAFNSLFGEEIYSWVDFNKFNVIPDKIFKESIAYDLECKPQDYLKNMFIMNLYCEDKDFKFLNVFPLKRSIIPGHIRIDTKILIDNFVTDVKQRKLYNSSGGIKMFKDVIWNEFFRTEKKIFNSNTYKFTGSIQTDGFSISILQMHRTKTVDKFKKAKKETYIDEIVYDNLKPKDIISIDPNKDDLIYCIKGSRETNDLKKFRYTNNQRSKETRKRKNRKILLNEKNLDGTIINIETEISKFNSKTNNITKFTEYIIKKNEINVKLKDFYERLLWRKLKLSVYTRTQKSEMKMLERFKQKLSPPESSIIAFGDWSQANQMKYKEPSKGKSFRNLFRKAGYEVYLVNEFRTSKMCCNCMNEDGKCEKFLKINSPRPWKRDEEILCHGLVKCKTCNTMFNRDLNSCVNIKRIAENALSGLKRPKYLSKQTKKSLNLKEFNNHESVEEISDKN
jgi:hypothetical protein